MTETNNRHSLDRDTDIPDKSRQRQFIQKTGETQVREIKSRRENETQVKIKAMKKAGKQTQENTRANMYFKIK